MRRLRKLLLAAGFLAGAWLVLRELLEQPRPDAGGSDDAGARDAENESRGAESRMSPAESGNGAGTPSKAELYREAQRLGVEGRSKMSKDELADAVAAARR